MLGNNLDSFIEESVCRLIVAPAICSPTTAAALSGGDDPQLIIWQPLITPVSNHGVDLTI